MGAASDNRRTVRILAPHYYTLRSDSDVGGEVYERMLLERLPAYGIEVLAGLPRDHALATVPAGWRVQALRHRLGLHWVAAPLVFTPWAVRAVRAGGVDLLRGHSVRHTGPSLLLARALSRPRVPLVIHHHHTTPRWRRLEHAILRRADAVITVSEFSRRGLIAAGLRSERLHVVYDGVVRPPETGGWASAWPLAGGLKLLSVGRLEARKRPELAVETLVALRHAGIDASLVVAGDGAPEVVASLAQRVAERGLSDRVRFVGRVTEDQKWRLYDSADVFLFGSTLEGFGLVVAEAQSRGVPVVAAAGTATAEAMLDGESGFLVAPDAEAFAAAVARLADDALRARMSAEARSFAARFDWDRCAADVAAVYRSLV